MLTLLKSASLDSLAAMHDRAVRALKIPDVQPVRKFRSRAQAVERVEGLVSKYHLRVVGTDKRPRLEATPEEAAPEPEEYGEDAVIRVIERPKALAGSLRARRIAALRDGMTVGQYLDAAYEANDKTRNRSRSKSDLRRFLAGSMIRIESKH